MRFLRTDSHNADFKKLVQELDQYLAVSDGEDHPFYDQFNKLDHINHVIVVYDNSRAVSCGAIKGYDSQSMEIKRMYTKPDYRGRGMASLVLKELEKWALELSYHRCILETGINQQEAIALYKRCDYKLIQNYGQYAGVENSFCFEK